MIDLFKIDWPAKTNIRALTTTRIGGVSKGVYTELNLGDHVNDDESAVRQNRAILTNELNLPAEPKWLNQTHSTKIVVANEITGVSNADGSYTTKVNCPCVVMTADCLPVFIAGSTGECVGVFHVGWRGLANGILKNAVEAMHQHSNQLIAAIGPAISQMSFEVGSEVKEIFVRKNNLTKEFFIHSNNHGHYYADLYGLAALQLNQLGIESVWLPDSVCTYKDQQRFYSYRRDGQTGRMASLIWISP